MKGICSKCGEAKEIIVIGLPAGEEETQYFCKHCAEEKGYIKPYSQVETSKRREK